MSMRWRGHSRCKHRLHVLNGIGARGYRERTDCADVLPAGRVPICILDREQPNFSKGLQDCDASSFRGFRGLQCRDSSPDATSEIGTSRPISHEDLTSAFRAKRKWVGRQCSMRRSKMTPFGHAAFQRCKRQRRYCKLPPGGQDRTLPSRWELHDYGSRIGGGGIRVVPDRAYEAQVWNGACESD